MDSRCVPAGGLRWTHFAGSYCPIDATNRQAISDGRLNFSPATQEPTPGPTVYHGSGVVSFGTDYDHSTGGIINPKTTFDRFARRIAWSARFSEEPGGLKVPVTVARRSGGCEKLVYSEQLNLSKPTVHGLSGRWNLPDLLGNRAGTYVMRFVRGGTVLAEGRFSLQ